MTPSDCDLETGVCAPAPLAGEDTPATRAPDMELVYVGDPMCSWCWGIAPQLERLREHAIGREIPFRLVVGGLRPGGGDEWNAAFKQFLEHHWREIAERTGQPFGFDLLRRESFHYDTEPACRAVVAARPFVGERELEFFSAIQRKFYVDNEDPKALDFYPSICAATGVDFAAFAQRFADRSVIEETLGEFRLNRSWGVTGYPAILVRTGDRKRPLARGYATFDEMRAGLYRAVDGAN